MEYEEIRNVSDKQVLRDRYLSCRNGLSLSQRQEKSAEIWARLKAEPAYRQAKILLVYMDYRSEVLTAPWVEELLSSGEKRVFAPKVEGMEIQFYEVGSMSDFAEGYQGIREPAGEAEKRFTCRMAERERCMLLLPGAVFDRQRGRMGYGKGFYDRFLASFLADPYPPMDSFPSTDSFPPVDFFPEKEHLPLGSRCLLGSAALAFECQIAERVPMEAHDRRPDMIVTEREVIR